MKVTEAVSVESEVIEYILPGEVFSYEGRYYLVPRLDGISIPQDRSYGVSLGTGAVIDLAMDTVVDKVTSGSIELKP